MSRKYNNFRINGRNGISEYAITEQDEQGDISFDFRKYKWDKIRYERDVHSLFLLMSVFDSGSSLLNEITRRVTIVPYTNMDELNAMAFRNMHIEFTPYLFNTKLKHPLGLLTSIGQRVEPSAISILYHELVHILCYQLGVEESTTILPGHFDEDYEFYAIVLANIFRSESEFIDNANYVRMSHKTFERFRHPSMLLLQKFKGFSEGIEKMKIVIPDIYKKFEKIDTLWNPIRDFENYTI